MRTPLCIFVLCSAAVFAKAQNVAPADTLETVVLDELVVTADRSATIRTQSTAAVSVLQADELRPLAGVTGLADVLRLTPGFALLHIDGLGYDPQPVIRGFYGGGEAEYVVVMLDGQPLNVIETGLVNWNQIPLASVRSVEIVRGGTSSLYGDAAIGGVVNVVTAGGLVPHSNLSVAGGTYGTLRAEAAFRRIWAERSFGFFGNLDRTAGFRDHATRLAASGGLSADLVRNDRTILMLSGHGHTRTYDVPGPLTSEQINDSRTQESVFFRLDNNDERVGSLVLRGRFDAGPETFVTGSITGVVRSAVAIRTLPLSAEFADAKQRELSTSRLFVNGQVVTPVLRAIVADRLTVGADAQIGSLSNTWYNVATGPAQVFAEHSGAVGDMSTKGEAARSAVAAYSQYDVMPASRLRLSLGVRYDRISDVYTPDGGGESTASHTAVSPKVGLNVSYVRSAKHVGNWYANVSRSFKAPTLDQLYDQREIPVPFPPYGVTISNGDLKPQRGISLETGLYHRATIVPNRLATEFTLSVYQMDMTDELDFRFETFQYDNIAESRHRGLEFGAKLAVQDEASLVLNYTVQDVTYQAGSNKGNYVKAIPRTYLSIAAHMPLAEDITVSGTVRSARRIWLDDANTVPLDDYASADLKLTYNLRWAAVMLEVLNLLDNEYSTTGFPDPAGSDTVFLYPAAGRAMRAGIQVGW